MGQAWFINTFFGNYDLYAIVSPPYTGYETGAFVDLGSAALPGDAASCGQEIDLGGYLSQIASAVMRSHAVEGIRLNLQVDTWPVSVNVAMPTGLVVNELLTNALKHAFKGKDGGRITVHCTTDAAGGCQTAEELLLGHALVAMSLDDVADLAKRTHADVGRVAEDLLLEFGVVSRLSTSQRGEFKVVVSDRRDARLFAERIGFFGRKRELLSAAVAALPTASTSMSADHVPFIADYIRSESPSLRLQRHNIDRTERWERGGTALMERIEELARMLGGVKITDKTREHARENALGKRPRKILALEGGGVLGGDVRDVPAVAADRSPAGLTATGSSSAPPVTS